MNSQELSHHREMQRLTRLTQELRQSCTTRQTLDAFHRGFAEEDEPARISIASYTCR